MIGLCTDVRHYALITAFVSGGDLHELLSSDDAMIEKMEVRISIARQIAIGMVHLHYNRPPVVHYDLKSVNILFDRKGDDFICKVISFENFQYLYDLAIIVDLRLWSFKNGK